MSPKGAINKVISGVSLHNRNTLTAYNENRVKVNSRYSCRQDREASDHLA